MSVDKFYKLKVCHVTSAHSRYDVRIFHKECKSLANNGYDVTLLVNDNNEDEILDGVKIKSTCFNPKNRYERMIVSQRNIRQKAAEINADIYHFHDPELLPLASKLKHKGKKVIFDFHEDVSQQILTKDWIPGIIRKIVSKLYKIYESQKAKEFDALITVTPKFVERLSMINPNTVMVTNYPILSKFDMSRNHKEGNYICFAGGITGQWNHINIIKAIEKIEGVTYLLAGSGPKEYISVLKSLDGWEKVDYLGRIPHEEVKDIYAKSIVGMTILSHDTQVGNEGTLGNTKIFEFMEAGLPVICSDNNLWKNMIDKYKCGIAVNPDSIEEIREAIEYIMSKPNEAKAMGENGKKAVMEEFNWKTQEEVLIDLYHSLL